MEEEDAGKSAMELEAEALEAQMREEARLGQA